MSLANRRWLAAVPTLLVSMLVSMLVVLLMAPPLSAAEPVQRIDWTKLRADKELLAGEVVEQASGIEGSVLRVKNGSISIPTKIVLVQMVSPPITTHSWHLAGLIRYQGIKGDGHFELLSLLPSGNLTSKSLADGGARGKLHGSSDWRPLWLPVDASSAGHRPSKLVLAVHLPPDAAVEIGPLALYEGFGDEASVTPGAWWGERVATLLFVLIAVVVVLLAPLLGLLAQRKKAQLFVLTGYRSVLGSCFAATVVAIVALVLGQPYLVYFPLLLLGMLGGGVFAINYRKVIAGYRDEPDAVIEPARD